MPQGYKNPPIKKWTQKLGEKLAKTYESMYPDLSGACKKLKICPLAAREWREEQKEFDYLMRVAEVTAIDSKKAKLHEKVFQQLEAENPSPSVISSAQKLIQAEDESTGPSQDPNPEDDPEVIGSGLDTLKKAAKAMGFEDAVPRTTKP